MKKITASAIVALLIIGSAPVAMAREHHDHFDRKQVAALLTSEGYNVERVEVWGEYVRAFLADGSMAYFDPDTLRPVVPF